MREEVGVVWFKTINDQYARVVLAQFLAPELDNERGWATRYREKALRRHTSVSFMNAFKMGSV